ncbi:hypothetical protein QE152_g37003 [Popillia japonica]|uniref:Uncharacterized protein n=1 Tax=Popillia japonica TaxID=7064 RepID=A0AAW1IBX7_POPJA
MGNGDHKHLNNHLSSLLNHLDNYKIASKQSQHLWNPTEETQWIEETQQEFEEDNYEHENYTSLMEQTEIAEEEPISCIKLNTNTSSKLPHIFLPEINAKFLVDTGSSRSMVSNEKVKEYFCEYLI